MPFSIDPIFTLQLLIALFVMATLQAEPAKAEATTPDAPAMNPSYSAMGTPMWSMPA